MTRRADRPRLVGRDGELEVLRGELARASAAEFRCVVLVGEPGVGKTRLAGEILARHGAASIVLSARAHPLGDTTSFGVWAEAFESHLRNLAPAEVAEACGSGGRGDLAGLLRSVADLPEAALTGAVATGGTFIGAAEPLEPPRARLLEGLAVLARNLAGRRRVIALLDDLHWADPSSFAALRYLAHNLATSPVLVLATARPYELAADGLGTEVLLGLEQDGVARRLELGPVTPEGIGALAASVLDRPPPAALVDWLAEHSGGSPLFAHGLLRALAEEGSDLEAPRLRRVPHDLAGRVEGWMTALAPPARGVLELLAVVGRRLALGELAAMTEGPEAGLGNALDELERRGLVSEEGQGPAVSYEVTHPVVTEIIYGRLGAVRRRTLHRQAARALFADGRPGEAAAHFARCADRGDPEAVEALRVAISQAERRHAYHELYAVLAALVELLPSGDERWLAVFEVMDPDAIGVIEGRTDRNDVDPEAGVRAMRAIDAVLRRSGDPVRRGLAQLRLANFAGWGTGELDVAEEASREAIELFRSAGDTERELVATCQLSWLCGIGGDFRAWEATARGVVIGSDAAGLDGVAIQGLTSLGMALFVSGQHVEAEAVLRHVLARCAGEHRHAYRAAWTHALLSGLLADLGPSGRRGPRITTARSAAPDLVELAAEGSSDVSSAGPGSRPPSLEFGSWRWRPRCPEPIRRGSSKRHECVGIAPRRHGRGRSPDRPGWILLTRIHGVWSSAARPGSLRVPRREFSAP